MTPGKTLSYGIIISINWNVFVDVNLKRHRKIQNNTATFER